MNDRDRYRLELRRGLGLEPWHGGTHQRQWRTVLIYGWLLTPTWLYASIGAIIGSSVGATIGYAIAQGHQ